MRRRPNGRTTGCYPENAGSTPAVAVGWGNPWFPHWPPPHAHRMDPPCLASPAGQSRPSAATARAERSLCLTRFTPRSLSQDGARYQASRAGDAGSNPARGLEMGEPGVPPPSCSRARLATRPGCLPGEAGSIPVESASRRSSVGRAPRSYRGRRGFDSSRRDCVARLVASPRAVTPTSRVRFPGGAPSCSRAGIRRADSCRSDPRLRRGRSLKASPSGPQRPRRANLTRARASATTGRLARRRSDTAVYAWFDSTVVDSMDNWP